MDKVLYETELGRIIDRGMSGDYPYSSCVHRTFEYKGKIHKRKYYTEINPRGELTVDYHERIVRSMLDGNPHPDSDFIAELMGFELNDT